MNSPHQREQLPDLLSDALDDTQRARVESHLRECEQCARELRQLQQMQATIASLPVAPVPVSVRAGVRAALREKPRSSFALPFAFPFPLRSRQLAWGGAAVAGAIGLMLLARPALQQDAYTQSAPVDETQLAARADQNSADHNGATAGEAVKPQTLAPRADNQPAAKSQAAPKAATRPERKPAPKTIEQLPVLPPPPAPVVSSAPIAPQSPQDSAPVPQVRQPDFAFPDAPRPIPKPETNPAKTRPIAPTNQAATARGKTSATPAEKPKVAPKTGAPTTKSALPAPKSATQSANGAAPSTADSSESHSDGTNARSNAGGIAPDTLRRAHPAPSPLAKRAERAKVEQPTDRALAQNNAGSATSAQTSAQWPGGQIKATLASRADAQSGTRVGGQSEAAPATQAPRAQAFAPPPQQPLILTVRVANPIGQARLILLTPAGELTVWRGVLNDQVAQIELAPATLDKARAPKGQTVRARLEQIDGDGNPKSSSTFEFTQP